MRYGALLRSLSLLIGVSGCGGLHPQLMPEGLRSARGQFVVEYAFPNRRTLAGGAWSLDNFSGTTARSGPDYRTSAYVDDDGDGSPELDVSTDLYDARLVHRTTGTVLWLRSVPTASALAARAPEFLAMDYAEAVTGGSYFSASFGSVIRERRYATEVTRRAACRWDGIDAYAIEFTVQNVDRAVIGVTEPDYLVTIVLAHAPAGWNEGRTSYPSVLVAGLAGRPADAALSAGAFAALLEHVRIRDAHLRPRSPGETTCPGFDVTTATAETGAAPPG